MVNYGKEWERRFEAQWRAAFPSNLIERIHDQTSGYKTVSQNISDYYAFLNQKLIYLECKETKQNTLNFTNFPQLDRMLQYTEYENVLGYVVIWFRTKQRVVAVDVAEADKIRKDGHASIALSMLDKKLYNIIDIPTSVCRTYPKCDFSIMKELI